MLQFIFLMSTRLVVQSCLTLCDLATAYTQFSSVQSLSPVRLFATPWTAARQASLSIYQLPELAQTHVPTISSSVVPFSSCLQSFPASRSFPMSQFFTSGGRSIGASASAAVLPMNIQD